MLPVNIEGVIWLTTNYTTYNTPIIVGVLAYVLLVLSCCIALIATFFWFSFKEKCLTLYLIATVVCCMISFLVIYHGEKKNQVDFIPEPISYVVYIDDNADYDTINGKFKYKHPEDNLTTIVLKEN